MSTLMYDNATDIKVTRDYMANLQTPPGLGARHAPVPFFTFADTTVAAIKQSGFKVLEEDYAITKDENRMFGLIRVSNDAEGSTAKRHDMLVGLRGSHDQAFSRALTVGSRVLVCSNLCFHGDLGVWKSKQTTNIAARIPSMVSGAVAGLGAATKKLTVDFDNFTQTPLTRDQGDDVLLGIFRSGGFSPSQLGRAIDDWDECSIEEHTQHGRGLWWLFNSATHALKPTGQTHNHVDLAHRSAVVFDHVSRSAGDRQIGGRTFDA